MHLNNHQRIATLLAFISVCSLGGAALVSYMNMKDNLKLMTLERDEMAKAAAKPKVVTEKPLLKYEDRIETVLKVTDGDTIKVRIDLGHDVEKKIVIRLVGLDCPEKNTAAGKLVMTKTARWLEGRSLMLQSKSLDLYKRSLGVVVDLSTGETLNDYLLKGKMAVVNNGEKRIPWTKEQLDAVLALKE